MLTIEKINKQIRAEILRRGKEIYEQDKILEYKIDNEQRQDEENLYYINAKVQGSGMKKYHVSIAVDYTKDRLDINNSFCECPAFAKYDGFCKHCAAVLLRHVRYNEQKDIPLKDIPKQKQKKKQKRLTTASIHQLFHKEVQKKSLPILENEVYGRIELEPHLKIEGGELKLHFKLGLSKKYVLKNLITFVEHIEKQEEYSYGKNLTFTHMREAFSKDSLPFLDFIIRWVRENKENYRQVVYYGYYNYGGHSYTYSSVRFIPIEKENIDSIMDCLKEIEFSMGINQEVETKYRLNETSHKDKLTIKGLEDGIEVKLNTLPAFLGEKRQYYFQNDGIFYQKMPTKSNAREFLGTLRNLENQLAYIQKEDMQTFIREILPALKDYLEIKQINFDEDDYGLLEAKFKFYLNSLKKDIVSCEVNVEYGEKKYSLFNRMHLDDFRDWEKERVVIQVVSSLGEYNPMENAVIIEGDDQLYEFFAHGIERLQQCGEVYISDNLKNIQVHDTQKVSVGVSLDGGILELNMSASEISKEELIEILMQYKRKKKYYRLKNGDFVQMEESALLALSDIKESLLLTEKELSQEKIKVPRYRALYLDSQLKEHAQINAKKNKEFKALIRNMKTVEDSDFEIPESLNGTLREYQKKGYLWLKTLKANGFCGILADDMGLGKTLQVIAFLLMEESPTLIATPASLVYNWKSELEKFAPELAVRVITGTALKRKQLIRGIGEGEVILTSYDLLKRDLKEYKNIHFANQVIDEAQYIKNQGTQVAKAVKEIDADFKLALTGTPVENKLSELWSIFDYLMPGFLYSYAKFKKEMESPIAQSNDENALHRLQKMVRPFVLRRLKKEVLTDLPDKLEETMVAQLEGEQQKLYDAHVQKLKISLSKQSDEEFKKDKLQILSELTRLRQLCCDPSLVFESYKGESAKLELCINLISNAVNAGHKILVFSQFTTMLDKIESCLTKEKISYYELTGSTPKAKRIELVEAFNKNDTSVFCISLKAGGSGLNLTGADMVIHYDPWWNVAVQNQATDRVHRIGQKNIVNVYQLVVKNSVEENILKLQEKKKELADQILSGEGMGSGSFSKDELLELLG